jgi:uncharacterized protein YndB with AHSA1/START domain
MADAKHQSGASRVINATPRELYDAFVDPGALVEWLPPGNMTGEMHEFDARIGGGYRMSLYYPESDTTARGKTGANEDMVQVRFVELSPPDKIVEAVTFVSENAALRGEMQMTITFTPVASGTEVGVWFDNLPAGVRVEDNDEGSRLSLEQLASRFERNRPH